MLIAVIVARKHSRRLPGKNLKKLAGVSLVGRAVLRAKKANVFDRIIVSTDSREIAEEAEQFGAEIPFIRPAELACDHSESVDVLIHAVRKIVEPTEQKNVTLCLMQPTSPLVSPDSIHNAVKKFRVGSFNSLSSMTEVLQHPEWMFRLNNNGSVAPAFPEKFSDSSRNLRSFYIENGAIYLVKASWLLEKHSLYDLSNHGIFLMSREESLDIDTLEDWKLAEFYIALDRPIRDS
ncbi:MAG: cytidylyltransferase domain-containing protein [Candidatus Rifleibacteriota bacterium]